MTSKKKSQEKHHDLLETPEALQEKLTFVEKFASEHKQLFLSIFTIIVLLVAAGLFYKYYVTNQDEQAQIEMFQAVYYFEADSLDLALNGDGNNLGLLDIIDEFAMTKTANLAQFYVGASYLKKGNFNQAIHYLEEFDSDDFLIMARASVLIGDAYMELSDYSNAAAFYNEAVDYKPNKYFTPHYMMKAALALEKNSDFKSAADMYERIIIDFWDSPQVQEAKKQRARIEEMINS